MLTKDNSKAIAKISTIVSISRIHPTKELLDFWGPTFSKEVKRNAKKLFLYKIVYRSQAHKVVGFIIEPKVGKKLPCVIYNRGGSREFGALKIGGLFAGTPAQIALDGYIVIASQYSGNGGSEGKDEMGGGDLYDVLNLEKILKKYPRANAKKIGMYGISRGGMMTYLSLTKVRWIKATVTVGGPTNVFREEKLRPEMKKLNKEMFGGSEKEKQKRSAVFLTHLFPSKTPLLIMHGTADWRVSPLDSIEIAEKLYENKIPYRLVLFEGADHTLSEHENESNKLTLKWFNRFLKNQEKTPNIRPHGR